MAAPKKRPRVKKFLDSNNLTLGWLRTELSSADIGVLEAALNGGVPAGIDRRTLNRIEEVQAKVAAVASGPIVTEPLPGKYRVTAKFAGQLVESSFLASRTEAMKAKEALAAF
jgi:hypothetical protein